MYHKLPINVVELSQFIRISDLLIEIDQNRFFIIYQFTNESDALKAAQNLIFNLDKHFNEINSCYVAIDKLDTSIAPLNVLNRLQSIIEYALKNRVNRVETEEVLDFETI